MSKAVIEIIQIVQDNDSGEIEVRPTGALFSLEQEQIDEMRDKLYILFKSLPYDHTP